MKNIIQYSKLTKIISYLIVTLVVLGAERALSQTHTTNWAREFVTDRVAARTLQAIGDNAGSINTSQMRGIVQGRIVGGNDATNDENPFQVALLLRNIANTQAAQFCGGTLVTANRVVTAAHCSDFIEFGEVQVLTGARRLDGTGTRRDVSRIAVHPNWNRSTFDNDVAVWELTSDVPGSDYAQLATSDGPIGGDLLATGWGSLTQGGVSPINLQAVRVPLVTGNNCNDTNSYAGSITSSMICAGFDEGGRDSCQGDSGGPLTRGADNRVLTGVVSWGIGCAQPNLFGVYARVSEAGISSFLEDEIGQELPNIDADLVVVWADDRDENGYLQIRSRGLLEGASHAFADFTVNDVSAGQQLKPQISALTDGGFIVVWEDDQDENGRYQVLARGFNANGSERIPQFTVNSVSDGQQLKPQVSSLTGGGFVVVWEDDQDENGFYQILGRGFNADGSEMIPQFTVNTVSNGQQLKPQISALIGGGFVVVWEDDQDENGWYQILGRGFNADGSEGIPQFTVNTVSDGQQFKPQISVLTDGSFVVVWEDDQDKNGWYEILARGFEPDGSQNISQFTVNEVSRGEQLKPQISALTNGGFAVVWEDDQDENGWYEILARGFHADGSVRIQQFTVNEVSKGEQREPGISPLIDGGFAVVWEDDQDENGWYEVLARGFDFDGSVLFNTTTVNSDSRGHQTLPSIVQLK